MNMAVAKCQVAWCLLLVVFAVWQGTAHGQENLRGPSPPPPFDEAELAFFESQVRPVLIKHCYDCHSAEAGAAEGGLRVDSREALLRGGDRGPALVPGDPAASLLITAATHADADLKMPPKQPRLSDRVLADLKTWIKQGAPDPRRDREVPEGVAPDWDTASAEDHWAYRPLPLTEDGNLNPPPRPTFERESDNAWPRRDLDRYILAGLKHHDLSPSPDASAEKLLRRLHFDLVGLPPTPDDLRQFERQIANAGLDAAIEDETDRLLALPQFGERWGRHWLDVARFGESSGKEANISFPYAWRYRDYVIDAFNRDLPYDRFLTEQIAGDLLPYEDDAARGRLLIATGFLALGPKNLDEMNQLQFLADVVDEQIDSVTRSVLASSVACARCHDHKFDPFSMRDYYALAGVFASTETFFGTSVSPANRVGGQPLPLPTEAGYTALHSSIPAKKVAQLQADLATLQQEEEAGRAAVRKAIAKGKDPSGIFTITDALRIFWRSGAIRGQLHKVSESGKALPLAMGVRDRAQIFDVPLLERGEISRPSKTVPRAFPAAIRPAGKIKIPHDQSGRLEFAQWLTHPRHPLTSRVLVNRVWKHLFGTGLVATVDNFGTTGAPPSHPALLDHLAIRFLENDWSIKLLVREMVLSRTYRQASDYHEAAFLQDPDNRWLGRASKRRLEAEAIRDAMLAVSGELEGIDQEPGPPLRNIETRRLSLPQQRAQLDLIRDLNAHKLAKEGHHPEIEGAIESFELAFRMQGEIPELLDVNDEPEAMLQQYGIGPGLPTNRFGRQCLVARRLAEAGVRFIEITPPVGWDHHFRLKEELATSCAATDQPIAALLADLKQRGMLDETLVIWAGEFGRTPHAQSGTGRDHNHHGYTLWMAGGGIQGGLAYGATDDLGGKAVEDPVHIHDWHATILHLLGLDHQRLTFNYAGRDFRLTDVYGDVVHDLLQGA